MSFMGLACLILITIFSSFFYSPSSVWQLTQYIVPPLGVFLVAGCGADLLVNLLLTFLGYVSITWFHLEVRGC